MNAARVCNEMTAFVKSIDLILCNAFGVDRIEQIRLRFVDHIPHHEVVVPLMHAVGGQWAKLLAEMTEFSEEQRAKLPGAGAGVALDDEGKKAVSRS